MNLIKKIIALTISALLFICLLAGCAAGQQGAAEPTPEPVEEPTPAPTPEPTPEPTATPESAPTPTPEPTTPSYRSVGTQDENSLFVLITNETGQDIVGLEIRQADEAEYSDDMLTAGQPIVQEETIELRYLPFAADDTTEAQDEDTQAESEAEYAETFLVRLTLADESLVELHEFVFGDTEEVKLCVEDGVGYIEYISLATGDVVNTKESELQRKEQAEQQTQAEKKENTSDNGGGSQGDPAPVVDQPEQSVDECIEDEIAWNE